MAASAKDYHVFCVDISPSMGQPGRHGDSTSHLETSLKVMNQMVQQKMFAKSHDEFAVVLCGTEETSNDLSESEGGYENITVAMEMAVPTLDLLHFIETRISPSTASADFIDALVVCMDVLAKAKEGRTKVGSLKVFLFTDAASGYSDDGLAQICRGLKEMNIQLFVIGPDVQDGPTGGDDDHHGDNRGQPGSGVRGKKTQRQLDGERLLQRVVDTVDGELFSFGEALKVVSVIQTRAKKQTTRFTGSLEIGSKLKIQCKMFTKGMVERPATWKKLSAVSQSSAHPSSMAVHMERSYHKQDEDETEVEMEDVAKGYRYGKSLIPISSADEEAMKLEYERCLQVLGFTHNRHVGPQLTLGSSVLVVVATPGDEEAGRALSAVIHALYEKQQCAVARYVWRAKAQARLVALRPCIKKDYECLLLTQLPFSEDLRPYYFGSLPASDKTTPTADQLEAVDNLITAMDLMEAHEDEEGGRCEAFQPKLMFNPLLQRAFHAIRHRAMHPDQLLPELDPLIARHLHQSEGVVNMAAGPLQRVKDVFPLKEVEQKGKGKGKKAAAEVWKESDADVDGAPAAKQPRVGGGDGENDTDFSMASLARGVVKEVGTLDPVKDYITLLGKGADVEEVSKQLQKVILKLVKESFGDMSYPKALDCLTALRQQAIKHSCPQVFNDFLPSLKEEVIGTRYSPFWGQVIGRSISLITLAECSSSKVGEKEAKELLSGDGHVTPQGAEPETEQQEDADDLLEMM